MKKIPLLLVLMLTATMAFAGIDLGIKAGYNANKLSTCLDSITDKFKSGFHVGAWVRFGKRFYVQPEIYYTFQKADYIYDDPKNQTSWNQEITFGTFDVPLLLGFKLFKAEQANVRVMAGPVFSLLIHSKVKDIEQSDGPIEKINLNTTNWGLQIGAGADISIISLDLRYQIPLSRMIEEVQDWNFNSHNHVFVISLGIRIL